MAAKSIIISVIIIISTILYILLENYIPLKHTIK